jgi:hypothetical protein
MHRHQLQRVLALASLVLARFERGVREKRAQRIGLAARLVLALLFGERSRGVHEFAQVLDSIGTVALGLIVLDQAACGDDLLDALGERQSGALNLEPVDERAERGKRRRRTPFERAAAASRLTPFAFAASWTCSIVRVPIPRGGKFATRRNALSSSGSATNRR